MHPNSRGMFFLVTVQGRPSCLAVSRGVASAPIRTVAVLRSAEEAPEADLRPHSKNRAPLSSEETSMLQFEAEVALDPTCKGNAGARLPWPSLKGSDAESCALAAPISLTQRPGSTMFPARSQLSGLGGWGRRMQA